MKNSFHILNQWKGCLYNLAFSLCTTFVHISYIISYSLGNNFAKIPISSIIVWKPSHLKLLNIPSVAASFILFWSRASCIAFWRFRASLYLDTKMLISYIKFKFAIMMNQRSEKNGLLKPIKKFARIKGDRIHSSLKVKSQKLVRTKVFNLVNITLL